MCTAIEYGVPTDRCGLQLRLAPRGTTMNDAGWPPLPFIALNILVMADHRVSVNRAVAADQLK
jgi:hypothetical protein